MPYKPFHREEYPLDILSEFGLTEEMIYDLLDYVHERLESGLKSPLLPISIRQPFGLTHCYAKFCLTETEDGIDVLFSPKLKEADLSSFTDKERSLLLAGKVIVSDIEETLLSADGEESTQKIKAFVQLDRDTNGVVYSPTQIIGRNLMNINNEFDLTPEDILSFQHGGLVTTTFLDRDERITIGLDLFSENGVVVVAGDASRWEKMVRRQMPEYSFGNDGCWVNRGGVLSYVPENEFTQDICDALLRQAQRYGVGIDEQRDSDGYSLQRSYLPSNEEARQLTRSC